jgi:hypothetical protein
MLNEGDASPLHHLPSPAGTAQQQAPQEQTYMYPDSKSSLYGRHESGMTDRSSFIPPSFGPGPGAYLPNSGATSTGGNSSPSAVIGTAIRRSTLVVAGQGTPGPGTYRLSRAQKYTRSPAHSFTPSWGFGTSPQVSIFPPRVLNACHVCMCTLCLCHFVSRNRLASHHCLGPGAVVRRNRH